jgi:hypothetical protein
LISVIRALSASETNEQRDTEKAKLEKEYKRSDQRLEELVSSHDQDLMEVMQVSRYVFDMITRSIAILCTYNTFYLRYLVHYPRKLHHHEKRFML